MFWWARIMRLVWQKRQYHPEASRSSCFSDILNAAKISAWILFAVRLLFWNQLRLFCLKNPSFSHMALGAPPWNPKFLRHRNTGKAKEKARYFTGFSVYSPQYSSSSYASTELDSAPWGNNTIMPLIWDVKVLIEQYPSSCQTKCALCFCQTKCTTLFFTPCVYFEKWQSAFLPHIF